MNKVKWIYYCRPSYVHDWTCSDRARVESEEEAIKWCEEKAKEYPGISFGYSKSCYVPNLK